MNRNLPTIVAIMFLVVALVAGVFLVKQRQYFGLRAQGSYAPLDLRITNITDSSFTVSFYTEKDALAGVKWGKNTLGNFTSPEDSSLKKLHYVVVKNLEPSTSYNFVVQSGDQEFNNNGISWSVNTSSVKDQDLGQFISGNVHNESGLPAEGSIIYLQIGGASPLSTQVSTNGRFLISLNKLRDQSLARNFTANKEDLINIFVQGGLMGIANAQILFEAADPVPDMKLGNSYDFTEVENESAASLPSAELTLPDNSLESRFEISETPKKAH